MIDNHSFSFYSYNTEPTPTPNNTRQHIKQPPNNKVFLPNLPIMTPQTNANIVAVIQQNKVRMLAVSQLPVIF